MKQLITCLLLGLPLLGLSQAPTSVQEGAIGMLSFNQGKIVSLAEAIPAETYDWRPEEGVRSVGEALLHMCAANYFFFMQMGATLPEGVNPMSMESDISGKENVIAEIKKSMDFAKEQIAAIETSSLTDPVKMPFPGDFNKHSVIMICVDHCAEHMGQLIAYARMNGVTPPWSAGN